MKNLFFERKEPLNKTIRTGKIISKNTFNNLFISYEETKTYIPNNNIKYYESTEIYYKIIIFLFLKLILNKYQITKIDEIEDYIIEMIDKFNQ